MNVGSFGHFTRRVLAPFASGSRLELVASVGVAVGLIAYVAVRSITIPITIDEALTARWHVPGSWLGIVLMRTEGLDDNNHILFTLLAKAAVATLGSTELVLRLPTLAGYALFLASSFLLLGRLAPGPLRPLALLALGGNPYLVDYFTVARGYGLGLGVMTAGLALFVDATKEAPHTVKAPGVRLAFLCFTLAALAHLTFLLLLVAAAAVLWIPFLWAGRGRVLWDQLRPANTRAWALVVGTAVLQVYLLHPLLVLRRQGLLEPYASAGLWMGTAASLVDGSLQDTVYASAVRPAALAWVAFTLALACASFLPGPGRPSDSLRALRGLVAIFLIMAFGSLAQHLLLGVSLLEGRRALALLVLFLLVALGLPDAFRQRKALRPFAVAIGALTTVALVLHALFVANVTTVRDWRADAASRDAIGAIDSLARARGSGAPLRLVVFWSLAPSIAFHRDRTGLQAEVVEFFPGQIIPDGDFAYLPRSEALGLVRDGALPVASYEVAGTMLVEPGVRTYGRRFAPLRP